ncbi:hypothetical protein CANINC_000507 [Pichia inconspicua]|uniref:Uncharacterized protein n=1 Tax=Pichia inconspicua TaxID=52247 RepID=A0A4T0X6G2_9ASCO|nr:hypothetical protein CANINC_000507 [[Candida] inconspicua]
MSASAITSLIKAQTNNAADGTGIVKLVDITKDFLGLKSNDQIPQLLIDYVKDLQQSQFGSYPDHTDVAPSAVFLAIFIIIFFAHGTLFAINYSRGHKFWLSFAFCFYALLRWLGFALRIVWAKDILRLHVGIASEVLIILPTVFIASFNLVLAQRIFTWRHPVFGNHKLFWYLMLAIYYVVISVVVMTIVAGVVPYLYFLSRSHYDMCRNVVKVTSVLVTLYSLLAIAFVIFTFILPVSKKNKEALVYQPFWIKSFAPTYFPPKNAQKEGEALFVQKYATDPREPKRTIVGGGMDIINDQDEDEALELQEYEQVGEQKFSLKHNVSIMIIAITSIFVFIGSLFRCIGCFMDDVYGTQSWIYKPVVMYVLWGALETICNILYLVGRIDLRFYRPDNFTKEHRELLNSSKPTTAEGKEFIESTNSSNPSSETRV